MRRARKPFTVEIRRLGRKKAATDTPPLQETPEIPTALPDPVVASPPVKPWEGKRILPALEQGEPATVPVPDAPVAARPAPAVRTKQAKPRKAAGRATIAIDHLPEAATDPSLPGTSIAMMEWHRKRTKTLARAAFRRGERWKVRLPDVVHR